jgi:hypothetical protein
MDELVPPAASSSSPPVFSKKKFSNWKAVEDKQLMISWLDMSQDPERGNQQTSNDFWQRVRQSFNTAVGDTERPATALQNQWHTIQ